MVQGAQALVKDASGRVGAAIEGAIKAWDEGLRSHIVDVTAMADTTLRYYLADVVAGARGHIIARNPQVFANFAISSTSGEAIYGQESTSARSYRVSAQKPLVAHLPLARINEVFGMLAEVSVETGLKEAKPPAGIKDVKRKKKKSGKSTGKQMRIHRIRGDGRCMFRALAQGRSLAAGKGGLSPFKEEREADELRMAVHHALCKTKEGKQLPAAKDAVMAITLEESMPRYCERVQKPGFWGGEAELLVLAQLLKTTIIVYIPTKGGERGLNWGTYLSIQTYGAEFTPKRKAKDGERPPVQPVHLCFNGYNHYDLLLDRKN